MDLGLKNRIALVTGAANGIGAAISERFAQEGAKVVIADIDGPAAERQADHLRSLDCEAIAFAVDVRDESAVETMVQRTVAELGSIDILVNNAGFTRDNRITKMDLGDWDSVIDVILKGAFLCSRAVIPHMTAESARWGRIVNIASRAHLGNPGQANYSAAKAGLIGFTRALSKENGKFGVTVNAVAPGIIKTEAVLSLPHYEKIRQAAEKSTPVPRLGMPQDVANIVVFLASEAASYISGDVIHVTGGRY
jgi:3-oxoacyl-[acyl-carrier protein] reductase